MITTDDPDLMLRLRAIRQWGIAVSEDLEIARGKKGTGDMGWGSNYKMTKIQAAVGLVQLRRLDQMIAPRVALAKKRTEMLRDVPELDVALRSRRDTSRSTTYTTCWCRRNGPGRSAISS